jgi:hypothetical protein
MKTGNRKATVHKFKAINKGKYKGTIHYELVSGNSFLNTKKLNISKDRGFAKSNPSYWLKLREGNKWSDAISGLFVTQKKYFFKGDYNDKESLILFKFSDNAETLTVFFFEGFYSRNLDNILKEIH